MEIFLLGFVVVGILYLTIKYGVRHGIDSSVQVKSLRRDLKETQEQIKQLVKKES